MTKKLTAAKINNLTKQTFTKKQVIIKDIEGREFEIIVDSKLKQSEMIKCFFEILARSVVAQNEGVEFDIGMNTQIAFLRRFTNLPFAIFDDENPVKSFATEATLMTNLLDLGLLQQIVGSFDDSERERFTKVSEQHGKQMKMISENLIRQDRFKVSQVNDLDVNEVISLEIEE